jgi:hypothetical protein
LIGPKQTKQWRYSSNHLLIAIQPKIQKEPNKAKPIVAEPKAKNINTNAV